MGSLNPIKRAPGLLLAMIAGPALLWSGVFSAIWFTDSDMQPDRVAMARVDAMGSIIPGEAHLSFAQTRSASKTANFAARIDDNAPLLTPRLIAEAATSPVSLELALNRNAHSNKIFSLSSSKDDDLLLSISQDGVIQLWSTVSGSILQTIPLPRVPGPNYTTTFAGALSPDGSLIAVGQNVTYVKGEDRSFHRVLYLIDAATGDVIQKLFEHNTSGEFQAVEFSPNGSMIIAAGGIEFPMVAFSYQGTRWEQSSSVWHGDCIIYDIEFSPAQEALAAVSCNTISSGGYVQLYNANLELLSSTTINGSPAHLAFSPDGSKLALAHWDRMWVDFLKLQAEPSAVSTTRIDIREATGRADTDIQFGTPSLAWSKDGRRLYVAGTSRMHEGGPQPNQAVFAVAEDGEVEGFDAGTIRAFTSMHGTRSGRVFAGTGGGDILEIGAAGVVAFSSAPSIAVFTDVEFDSAVGERLQLQSQPKDLKVSLDGKEVLFSAYTNDGTKTYFKFSLADKRSWLYNVDSSAFKKSKALLPTDSAEQISVSAWRNTRHPSLNGRRLLIHWNDRSRSVHVVRSGDYAILGTEFRIYKLNALGENIWPHPVELPAAAWSVNVSGDEEWIVAALGDGTIRWFAAETGQLALSLFIVPGAPRPRWLAWTPDGYYAASAGVEDFAAWYVGRGPDETMVTYSLSRFYEEFNKPTVVGSALERQVLTDMFVSSEISDAAPPRVQILDIEDVEDGKKRIRFKVMTDDGAPVSELRVFIDEETYPLDGARSNFLSNTEQEITIRADPCASTIAIAAVVGGKVSEVDRGAGRGPLHPCNTQTETKPDLFALLIGINHYDDENIKPLKYAVNDAVSFARMLESQKGVFYRDAEIKLLVDSDSGKLPTRENILDGLGWIQRSTINHQKALVDAGERPNDRTVGIIYVAGHGLVDPTLDTYFFLARNTQLSSIDSTAVKGLDMQGALAKMKGLKVAYLDSCYSDSMAGGSLILFDIESFTNRIGGQDTNAIVFASSSRGEVAKESARWGGHGAFTRLLLDGFEAGADSNGDTYILDSELATWLDTKLPELTEGDQTPTRILARRARRLGVKSGPPPTPN